MIPETIVSRNIRKFTFPSIILFAFSCLFSMTNHSISIYYQDSPTGIVSPDTLPSDSLLAIDTIAVAAAYSVTDTAVAYSAGLDSIFLLQEDTAIYQAQYDSTITYYLGDIDTSIHFEKPVDSIAFYFVTDSAAFYIPGNETNAYSLIKADTVNDVESYSEQNKIALTIKKDYSRIDIVTVSSIPKKINYDLYGINIEGLFKPHSLPYDGVDGGSSDYAYDWLAELVPG